MSYWFCSYNQGWLWQVNLSDGDQLENSTKDIQDFVQLSIGRKISPTNQSTEVMSGNLATKDSIFLTPFQYISKVTGQTYLVIWCLIDWFWSKLSHGCTQCK